MCIILRKLKNVKTVLPFQVTKDEQNYFFLVKEGLIESLVQNTGIIYENNLIIYEKVANTKKKF